MLKIIVAKNAGFCPGVKNAIDKVIELSKKTGKKIYTLGPLIHNKDVIKALEEKNIYAVENAEAITEKGAILVIRAHGIPPELESKIRTLKLEVIDGTCPLVKNAHEIIGKYASLGYHTVIVGDRDHAEVIGLMGYAGGKVFVVSGPEEAAGLPEMEKANIMAQTTQEEKVFSAALLEVQKKAGELVISNTICNPTKQRQRETVEFAKISDLVVVVGGRHSANTRRLFQICEKLAKAAILIEREDELSPEILAGKGSVFITAGASTPNWLIEKVYEKVKKLSKPEKERFPEKLLLVWKAAVTSGIYTGVSAAFLTYAASRLLGSEYIPKKILFISAMFVLSLHVLNRALEKSTVEADEIKHLLFIKFRSATKLLAYFFGVTAIAVSYTLDLRIFFSLSLIWLAGILYPYKLFEYVSKIPGSKDLVLAAGWTFACALIPVFWFREPLNALTLSCFAFIFTLSFMRSVLLSISQNYNDMIVGKENLYKALGETNTHRLLFFSSFLSLVFFVLCSLAGGHGGLKIAMLISLLYYSALVVFFRMNKIPDKITSEVVIDLQFILLGLASIA